MSEIIPVLLVTMLLLVVAIGIVMMVLISQKKQLQYINEKKQMEATFEKQILESKLEIQEQTMKNISQEIHDNIGQVLSIVKLNLNLMNGHENRQPENLQITTELVSQAIQDLRDLSKSLNGDSVAGRGLAKAIELDFNYLKKAAGYRAFLKIEGDIYSLSQQQELILFRIFQEVINNIIKHAEASLIEVKLSYGPQHVSLLIKDNGKGFDKINLQSGSGLGLRNMQTRSELIGASISIDSEPAKGTSVLIQLPVASR